MKQEIGQEALAPTSPLEPRGSVETGRMRDSSKSLLPVKEKEPRYEDIPALGRRSFIRKTVDNPISQRNSSDRGLPPPSFPASLYSFYKTSQSPEPLWTEKDLPPCSLLKLRTSTSQKSLATRRFPQLSKPQSSAHYSFQDFSSPVKRFGYEIIAPYTTNAAKNVPRPRNSLYNGEMVRKRVKGYAQSTEASFRQHRAFSPPPTTCQEVKQFIPSHLSDSKERLDRKPHGFHGSPYSQKSQDDRASYLKSKRGRVSEHFHQTPLLHSLYDSHTYLNSEQTPSLFAKKRKKEGPRISLHQRRFYI